MSSFKMQCLGLLAVSGVVGFSACGVSEVEPEQPKSSEAQPALGQTQQALWVDLYNDLGSPVATGSTYNAADEFSPPASCTDSSGGPDVSFKWTVPLTGSYTISTGAQLDSVLHIYTFSTTGLGTIKGCNDEAPGQVLVSSLTLNLTAGEVLRIVVDSYTPPTSRNGSFALNITPNFEPCPTPPGGCYLSVGTWTRNGCVYNLAPTGTACNDGNACTVNDVCSSTGACGGSPKVCNTPPGQCYSSAGTCSNGSCNYVPAEEGTLCSDGRGCTRGDSCNGFGGCSSGEDSCAGGYYCAASGGCQPLP
ncbi:hypothetical protein F0U59_32610 [Archangium gephyra]|nr:hypothetical protein F0U59_32610 [Archangium gephyra]